MDNNIIPESQKNELCFRCRSRPGVIICQACNPTTLYCEICYKYIHSLPSKRNHKIQNLNNDDAQYSQQYQNSENNRVTESQITNSNNYYYTDNPHININTKENYLDKLKSEYEKDKDMIKNEIMYLTSEQLKHSRNNKNIVEHNSNKLNYNTVNGYMKRNDESDMGDIKNYYEEIIMKLKNENKNLKKKITQYETQFEENKNIFNEFQGEILNLNNQLNDMNNYYLEKIKQITQDFNQEKQNIINYYEDIMNEKEIQQNINNNINCKDEYINNLIKKHNKEINDLNSIIEKLQNNDYHNKSDQINLLQINETLKNNLYNIQKELEASRIKVKVFSNENENLKECIANMKNSIIGNNKYFIFSNNQN